MRKKSKRIGPAFLWIGGLSALLTFGSPCLADGNDSAGAKTETGAKSETCKELIDRVKHSDCIKPLSGFLNGASLVVGLSLTTGQMGISSGDTLMANMIGVLSPSPYYGFSLPNRFFGSSRYGYETSFTYSTNVAIYQQLGGGNAVRDLGTYSAISFVSVSPSVFASIGARDDTPDKYFRAGFGLGAGWASVRGTAYFTEDSTTDDNGLPTANSACYDAAAALASGAGTKQGMRAACELQSYHHSALGLSLRFFIDARWRFLYYGAGVDAVDISAGHNAYTPLQTTVKLAYIHDL